MKMTQDENPSDDSSETLCPVHGPIEPLFPDGPEGEALCPKGCGTVVSQPLPDFMCSMGKDRYETMPRLGFDKGANKLTHDVRRVASRVGLTYAEEERTYLLHSTLFRRLGRVSRSRIEQVLAEVIVSFPRTRRHLMVFCEEEGLSLANVLRVGARINIILERTPIPVSSVQP